MKKRTVIGALGVIKKGNKFLMALRNEPKSLQTHHKWEFPGGEIEFDEKPEQALAREVMEEVGLKVKIISPFSYIETHFWKTKKITPKVILLLYLCEITKGKPYPAHEEIAMVKWFSFRRDTS